MKKNYVYMLRCADGSLYTGWTTDLEKRVARHNSGKASKCTRGRLPAELCYWEVFPTREQAMSREYRIKQLKREEKEQLVLTSTAEQQIRKALFELQDAEYREFSKKLIPTVEENRIIGVRTPALRSFAGKISGTPEAEEFLKLLPHGYYEENNLHGELIMRTRDFELALERTEEFLPYIDNWATCDTLSPKALKKHPEKFFECIKVWIKSDRPYTVRFAIVMLMSNFMQEHFSQDMLEMVSQVDMDEYYVKMAVAWYFSIALVKQYDAAVPYIINRRLDKWTHNKAIQKAVESLRIDKNTKEYLRSLRIR